MNSKITFEGFVALCASILGYQEIRDGKIEIEWTTGGRTGGSCWDTGDRDPHYAIEGEPEPEFEDLDRLLEALTPNMTFLQYKKIRRDMVVVNSRSRNDYYGNYTNMATKTVDLRQLYTYLLSKGHLDNLVVLIAGLPGSGKTTLAEKLGGLLVDDPKDKLTDLAKVPEAVRAGDLVVMTDPNFIKKEVREQAEDHLESLGNAKIIWIFFRNDPDYCIKNIGIRQKQGKDHQGVKPATVKALSKLYDIPEDAAAVPVWRGNDWRW